MNQKLISNTITRIFKCARRPHPEAICIVACARAVLCKIRAPGASTGSPGLRAHNL